VCANACASWSGLQRSLALLAGKALRDGVTKSVPTGLLQAGVNPTAARENMVWRQVITVYAEHLWELSEKAAIGSAEAAMMPECLRDERCP
jgi:hypothetical protein